MTKKKKQFFGSQLHAVSSDSTAEAISSSAHHSGLSLGVTCSGDNPVTPLSVLATSPMAGLFSPSSNRTYSLTTWRSASKSLVRHGRTHRRINQPFSFFF